MVSWICTMKLDAFENNRTTWFIEHQLVKLSMTAYQTNYSMEDFSQIEVEDNNVIIRIYDGHGVLVQ